MSFNANKCKAPALGIGEVIYYSPMGALSTITAQLAKGSKAAVMMMMICLSCMSAGDIDIGGENEVHWGLSLSVSLSHIYTLVAVRVCSHCSSSA